AVHQPHGDARAAAAQVHRAAAVAVAGRVVVGAEVVDDVRERALPAADVLADVHDPEAADLARVRAGLAEVLADDRPRPRADVELRGGERRADVDVVRRRADAD